MLSRDVVVVNALGLHARAAARFVQLASRFKSHIRVTRQDGRSADGKSILGLLTLIARQETALTLSADGADEREALLALVDLVAARFGEEQ
ncbi:MAG TPA: HPr family phosphocarrier protein [Candidatus Polarisedimenticolia bacterium]|nr:HPr family phosphocarrier protein [Candidatus Polarisedimenticolia bacterium]